MIGGVIATAAGAFLLIINLIYDQGDDIVNRALVKVINEEKRIELGSLNLSDFSRNLISEFQFPDITVGNIYIVKSFVDAKLDSSLADLLDFNNLPFKDLANDIKDSFQYAADNSVNADLITKPVNESLTYITTSILEQFDMFDTMNTSELSSMLSFYKENNFEKCETKGTDNPSLKEKYFNDLNESYEIFFSDFNDEILKLDDCKKQFSESTQQVPDQIGDSVTGVFGGFLNTMGLTFSDTIGNIENILRNVDSKFAVALFNIIRVRIFYQIMAYSMCVSISAHLYIVGMWAMVILLWVRRKGMAREERERSSDEYSISNNDDMKKKKEMTRGIFDDEMSYSKSEDEFDEFSNPYKRDSSVDDDNNFDEPSPTNTKDSGNFSSQMTDEKDEDDNGFSFDEPTNDNNSNKADRSSSEADSDNDNQQTYVF